MAGDKPKGHGFWPLKNDILASEIDFPTHLLDTYTAPPRLTILDVEGKYEKLTGTLWIEKMEFRRSQIL